MVRIPEASRLWYYEIMSRQLFASVILGIFLTNKCNILQVTKWLYWEKAGS